MPDTEQLLLLSPARIDRIIRRIAYQVIEDNTLAKPVFIAGIDQRGFSLANLLSSELKTILGYQPESVCLPVKKNGTAPDVSSAKDAFCILIDDVIFSGNTMLSGLNMLLQFARPHTLKVAALVDRGHRSVPIESDYIGIVSPTKLNEHVRCLFSSGDHPEMVIVERQ